MQLRNFPDVVLLEARKVSREVVDDAVAKDAFTGKVYDSYRAFQAKASQWYGVSELPYGRVRVL
jgi:TRAP-type mannitol/chloroaromatic compound transport system substrate-binding protein